ncbi:uncharacterized protein [Pseudorasbora parva]|uniref:uncharacterized protein n=1 Tax=Pseudorasbora parva TaxID=51549 RepID=UPI00351E01D5
MSIPKAVGNSWIVSGQESVEGSDGSGNERGEMEVGSGMFEKWETTRNNKRKKKRKDKTDESDSDRESNIQDERREEYVIFAKLVDEGDSFGGMNPMQLTKSLNREIGEIKSAKVLRNGALLVVCKDERQMGRAIKINMINKKKVECSMTYRKFAKGVITGIPVNVSVEEVKKNITNVKVNEVRRLKINRNGNMLDSLSVMINFDQEKLPERVYIGFMCYDVRLYIPPPLRCFKCQRFGHVAAVCKGKQRCGKCGGEHEYGKCQEGTKLKCCNCGGEHSSAYRGCEVSKRQAEVQRVKAVQGISYAEAARKVPGIVTMVRQPGNRSKEMNMCQGCDKLKEETLIVKRNDFVMFMAEIINCSAQTKSRNERIKIIVKSAEKYLDVKGLLWETVRDTLNVETQSSQACAGSS